MFLEDFRALQHLQIGGGLYGSRVSLEAWDMLPFEVMKQRSSETVDGSEILRSPVEVGSSHPTG